MNPEARIELDRITSKEPEELTIMEIAFLNARRSYLRPEQRMIFKSVLKPTNQEEMDYTTPSKLDIKIEKKKKIN